MFGTGSKICCQISQNLSASSEAEQVVDLVILQCSPVIDKQNVCHTVTHGVYIVWLSKGYTVRKLGNYHNDDKQILNRRQVELLLISLKCYVEPFTVSKIKKLKQRLTLGFVFRAETIFFFALKTHKIHVRTKQIHFRKKVNHIITHT